MEQIENTRSREAWFIGRNGRLRALYVNSTKSCAERSKDARTRRETRRACDPVKRIHDGGYSTLWTRVAYYMVQRNRQRRLNERMTLRQDATISPDAINV